MIKFNDWSLNLLRNKPRRFVDTLYLKNLPFIGLRVEKPIPVRGGCPIIILDMVWVRGGYLKSVSSRLVTIHKVSITD